MKILLIRFSSIGDIVLTTPVIRCLREQLAAEVHFLTKKAFAGILESNPHVHRVHTIEKGLSGVLPALKAERFDWVIDLHHNLRSARVKWALGVKSRSFDKINRQKWLMVNLKIDRLPRRHIVERYLDTVAHLGVKNDGKGLEYYIPAAEEVDLAKFFGGAAQPYAAFVIGAAHATKRLPEDRIIEICRQLRRPVVLLGGPGEADAGQRIAAAAGRHVYNTCGRLRLHQSASMVRQAGQVITHDTGLMHIAAAFRRPVISVWGNTIPAFGMYPYYPEGMARNTTFEVTDLGCRPCSKIGFQRCPRGHFRCMRDIPAGEVARAADAH